MFLPLGKALISLERAPKTADLTTYSLIQGCW